MTDIAAALRAACHALRSYEYRGVETARYKGVAGQCELAIPAAEAVPAVVEALNVVLDQVDYTTGAGAPTEMVGALLSTDVIRLARNALAAYDAAGKPAGAAGATRRGLK